MREDVAIRLAALTRRFLDRAMADSDSLEAIAMALERGAVEATVHEEIRRIAHRLSGAGGTFGFSGVSSYATNLEALTLGAPESLKLADSCRSLVGEIRRTT